MIVQLTTNQHTGKLEFEIDVTEYSGVMVHNFRHYVEDTYGHGLWHTMRRENKKLFTEHIEVYGDSVFQLVVDTLSSKLHLPIAYILQTFSEYLNDKAVS